MQIKPVMFKNCVLFTSNISKIYNILVAYATDLDAVMSIYNLIEHNKNHAKTLRTLLQYHKDAPRALITDFQSFKFMAIIKRSTPAAGNYQKC